MPTKDEILRYATENFQASYDNPFPQEDYIVLRASNKKWFGLISDIPAHYLEASPLAKADARLSLVVNLKVSPVDLPALLEIDGIYPAYHMNKTHWISTVVSSDTLPEIEEGLFYQLLSQSYELVRPKLKKKGRQDLTSL